MLLFLFLINLLIVNRTKSIFVAVAGVINLLFFVEVIFVDFFFGMDFSPKSILFSERERALSIVLTITLLFLYFFTRREYDLQKIRFNNYGFLLNLLVFMTVVLFVYYNMYQRYGGIGNFKEFSEYRSPIQDYILIFLIYVVLLFSNKYFAVVNLILMAICFLAIGERFRMVTALIPLMLVFFRFSAAHVKLLAIPAYVFAILIDNLRSSSDGVMYHISHFGSVVISSMKFEGFIDELSTGEKMEYYYNLYIGNFIPSILLNEYDIRKVGVDVLDVPGGGYYVYISYLLGGVIGFLFFIFFILTVVNFIQSISYSNYKNTLSVIPIIFFISWPKFLMYSPYLLTRFSVIFILISLILIVFFGNKGGLKWSTRN
jgi:hypothetical protein